MVTFIKKNIFLSILVVILLILGSIYGYRMIINKTAKFEDPDINSSNYEMSNKVYDINEYSNIVITDEEMARIYLNDYISAVKENTNESYYLLDEEYRNKRFGSVEAYSNYVNTWKLKHVVDKYYKKSSGDYIIYGVYDTDGNFFAFKTRGVMQYSVYLDDKTVEIW